jgi:hypothetical protein|tara:strand:- start:348 stop:836 length:489 start_codon:yes stop_codon:yes gene_type:complete
MNTYETNIIKLFLKYKNEKNFIEKVRKTLSKEIGFKLFTLTVMHPKKKIVTRIYSSNKKIYPVGGEKKIPKNYFTHITIKEKKSFIGNNKKQIEKYFYDHKVITDLGCESILNQVIVFNNETIGTMNLLNIKGHFNKEHLKKTNYISKFLVPIYLNHQLKAR